ncbi:hypothetical protein GQ54DRAFT_114954 [Martensiomyces pterosporus]|nr:hypothetical protein GQ54DRAFT_114954 [Martensiomyces pterosporus]
MFQNKSSTMPLRSRIPTRRAAAGITDENKVGTVAARAAKDLEPVKAGVKTRSATAAAISATAGATNNAGATVHVKSFGAKPAGIATRTRSALGEVGNVKAHEQATKLTKPGDVAAKLHARAGSKPGRVALSGVSKTALTTARARQVTGTTRATATASRPSSVVLGARPISKPSATFGIRRTRTAAASSGAAVAATAGAAKRVRSNIGAQPPTASLLGKHTRSGRATRTALRVTEDSSMEIEGEADAENYTDGEGEAFDDLSSTAASSVALSLKLESSAGSDTGSVFDTADSLGELKLVDEDTIDYALVHTGLVNEQPILMEEINEFEADVDPHDMTLIPEFGDDIFGYMRELEVRLMPDPSYMARQPSLTWSTRSILVEWLVQVHHRFNLLPETLYLCINFVDRFLSTKEILINKLQLVGAVCLLLASKYEEIHVPSIKDMVYMVEKNYTEEEILRAERFLLRMLNFDLGWPGPLSFLRRISKADDYDIATRTLAKYLIEVTLIDERFIGIPCSKVAATSHYLALRFLEKGVWTRAHAFYSGYFESELLPTAAILIEQLMSPRKHRAIYEKYADRRFLRASEFVHQWFKMNDPKSLLQPTSGDHSPESGVFADIQQQQLPQEQALL